jgi:hypothetical protein
VKCKRNTNPNKTPTLCNICQKTFLGPRALKSHNTQVHININRDNSKRGGPKGKVPWNKGLTKEADFRVLKNSISCSKTLKEQVEKGLYIPRRMGQLARDRLSEKQSLNNSGGKCKWYNVNGVKVQGSWERDIALKLSEMQIEWVKPKTNKFIFKYKINNKTKSYSPDFYLPKFDVYLEIKGYWWGNDRVKMKLIKEQYPTKKIVIIEKEEYKKILNGELVWNH